MGCPAYHSGSMYKAPPLILERMYARCMIRNEERKLWFPLSMQTHSHLRTIVSHQGKSNKRVPLPHRAKYISSCLPCSSSCTTQPRRMHGSPWSLDHLL